MSMNDAATDRKIRAQYQVLFIVWAAQVMSLVLFLLLAVFVLHSNEADDKPMLFWIFAGVGALLVLASFPLKQRAVGQAIEMQSASTLQQGYILAWVLCETTGLLGMLARAVTGTPYFYVLFILAGLGFLLHFPRREHLAAVSFKKQF